MELGVLINPRSRRNKSGFADMRALLAAHPRVRHACVGEIEALPEALRAMAEQGVDLLAVSGGDGTVQAVLSALQNDRAFATPPTLAILAGGTTNMIADDVGLPGRPEPALKRLIARLDDPMLDDPMLDDPALRDPTLGGLAVERGVIRVEYRPDAAPLCGMFFGTAAICRAILFCRRTAEAVGLTAAAASAATLAGLLGRRLLGRGGDDILRGDDMTVRFDGGPPQPGSRLLALVTTLDRLILRSRPFWGPGAGALRYSEVAYPPSRLLRAVYPFLYGGAQRLLPSGDYRSLAADRIAFEMSCPFTLDGELYDPAPGVPVVLTDGGRMRFLRC